MFTTQDLRKVLERLERPRSFLLDTFFPESIESDSEKIEFHRIKGRRRITPMVHPTRAGKIVDNNGFEVVTFNPAYAKDKRRWDPSAPLKRTVGEKIGGELSPQQRLDALVAATMEDQLDMLTMREEVMAAEALRTGKVTVSGDGYDTVVVDFGRDASLGNALLNNDRWSVNHADSDPLGDIEDVSTLVQSKEGGVVTDVIHDPIAFKHFRTRLIARGEDKVLLDYARASKSSVEFGPMGDKVRFIGMIGTHRHWVYQDTYIDDAGAEQKLLPDGTVLFGSSAIEGARCYGAIQDPKAGYKATRYFTKTWDEEDPAVRWMLLQSAPLVVPFRANGSARLTVI
jgi:hypothetical protein